MAHLSENQDRIGVHMNIVTSTQIVYGKNLITYNLVLAEKRYSK